MDHSPEPREITTRFEKLLAALVADKVCFVVVGGLAVIFNGYPRVTLENRLEIFARACVFWKRQVFASLVFRRRT